MLVYGLEMMLRCPKCNQNVSLGGFRFDPASPFEADSLRSSITEVRVRHEALRCIPCTCCKVHQPHP
jgi:hypothetical protein